MFRAAITRRFLDAYLEEQGEPLPDLSGELVTEDGEVLGRHEGIHNFTIGQRKGLGVATGSAALRGGDSRRPQGSGGGRRGGAAVEDAAGEGHELDFDRRLDGPMRVEAKIRHRHAAAAATVEPVGDDEVLVTFDEAQRSVTPGQAVVFYDGDVVVGGGWIF